MRPLDDVLVRGDVKLSPTQSRYKLSAGVVERIENGAVIVDMDLDHRRVSFPPAALKILKA